MPYETTPLLEFQKDRTRRRKTLHTLAGSAAGNPPPRPRGGPDPQEAHCRPPSVGRRPRDAATLRAERRARARHQPSEAPELCIVGAVPALHVWRYVEGRSVAKVAELLRFEARCGDFEYKGVDYHVVTRWFRRNPKIEIASWQDRVVLSYLHVSMSLRFLIPWSSSLYEGFLSQPRVALSLPHF